MKKIKITGFITILSFIFLWKAEPLSSKSNAENRNSIKSQKNGIVKRRLAVNRTNSSIRKPDLDGLLELLISKNKITKDANIEEVLAIQTLDFFELTDEEFEQLSQLPNLKHLYIDGTQISDLGPIMNMHSLEELNISSTAVTDLIAIQNLFSLNKLNIEQPEIANLDPIQGLHSLEELII